MNRVERIRDAVREAITRHTATPIATPEANRARQIRTVGSTPGLVIRTETTAAATGAADLLAAISTGDLPPTTVNLTTKDEHGGTLTYAICGLSRADGPDICA